MFAGVLHFVLMFGCLCIGLDRCVCWMMFEHYVGWHNKTMGKKGTECFVFPRVWMWLYVVWNECFTLLPVVREYKALTMRFNIFLNGLYPLDCVVPVVWKTFLFLPSVNSFIVWMRLFLMGLCSYVFNLKASSDKILMIINT